MATLGTRIYTLLNGKFVGEDAYGNRYYQSRCAKTAKRWVVYKGIAEPSKIPASWHGWMHYSSDTPPTEQKAKPHKWQQEHQPNLTGTSGAYLPPGHIAKGADRAHNAADYQPWKPK